jgi:hypothetical protein
MLDKEGRESLDKGSRNVRYRVILVALVKSGEYPRKWRRTAKNYLLVAGHLSTDVLQGTDQHLEKHTLLDVLESPSIVQ